MANVTREEMLNLVRELYNKLPDEGLTEAQDEFVFAVNEMNHYGEVEVLEDEDGNIIENDFLQWAYDAYLKASQN